MLPERYGLQMKPVLPKFSSNASAFKRIHSDLHLIRNIYTQAGVTPRHEHR